MPSAGAAAYRSATTSVVWSVCIVASTSEKCNRFNIRQNDVYLNLFVFRQQLATITVFPMTLVEQLESRRKAMTVNEVADILAVSPFTVYKMAADSEIPCMRILKGALRFDPSDIAEWLKKKKGPQTVVADVRRPGPKRRLVV